MSIKFPSGVSVPSNITIKPSSVKRPEFGTIYGFDADQDTQPEPGIDGAIFTQASEPLTTELDEILLFEPA
jgi:hypothetical protein